MPPDGSRPATRSTRASAGGGTKFTQEELAAHASPDSLWVSVRGKVYDVTEWLPTHPGGDLLLVAGGKDVTQLFDSYHPLRVGGLLPKYQVGELAAETDATTYEADLGEGQFYNTLKRRVESHFRDKQLDPRIHPAMYVKSAVILATLVASWLGAFFLFPGRWAASLACAVLLGVAKAEIGVSIMHDANHGAYSPSPLLNAVMGSTLDVAGASSFMWRQQHVVGHHAFTNVVDRDPDIRVSAKDVRRVASAQPWHAWHAVQHLYLGLLYGLLATKSIYVDDFVALAEGRIGPVRLARMTARERAVFWGGKLLYASYMLAAPARWSHHSLGSLLLLWAAADAVTGWMLALMFQVAHVVDEVAYLERGPTGAVASGWAAAQAATTADFCHGSWFWTHISGGLNHQVVHHLFPGICHCYYPQLAPIVLRTAAEFGVNYKVYKTFSSAVAGHFRQLRNMGLRTSPGIPSLSTVG